MVPGLVKVMVVPGEVLRPSASRDRAFFTISSYAAQNWAKSSVSQLLMLGTSSCRVPSGLGRSMARPRLMWRGTTMVGLPSMTS